MGLLVMRGSGKSITNKNTIKGTVLLVVFVVMC